MVYKTIDEKMVQEARSYVPLMEKAAFVEETAQCCFDRLGVQFGEGDLGLPMASMYKENTQLKSRYLMGALVKLYLGQDYESVEGDKWLMAADDYDRWAGGNPLGQLEQLKGKGTQTRERVFALLRDFQELQERMDREIQGLLQVMNDPVGRFLSTIQAQTTPEVFQKGAAELERVRKELEDYQKVRGGAPVHKGGGGKDGGAPAAV